MRTVPSAVTAAAGKPARIISSRIVVTDNRLRFSNLSKISHDSALYDGAMKSYDADVSGSSIYRVANVGDTLHTMYLGSPGGSWPNWTNKGIALKANSKPGIFKNRITYQSSNGNTYRRDMNGGSLGGATLFKTTSDRGTLSIAPISSTEVMVMESFPGKNYAKLLYMTSSTLHTWEGRIYGDDPVAEVFDAERDKDTKWVYCIVSDQGAQKARVIRFTNYDDRWGPLEDLIPMDVVDDLNAFHLGGMSTIERVDGPQILIGTLKSWSYNMPASIWVGGALIRTDGGHMQMYTNGPPWTNGRDLFVGTDGTEVRSSGGKVVPIAGGKMHFIGDKVYYIGPGTAYVADGTDWTGGTSPSTSITDIGSAGHSQEANSPARMIIDIPFSMEHAALREGSDLKWYASIYEDGNTPQEVKMGTFNIDAIIKGREAGGKFKTIIARSKSGKDLAMWSSDTSYDYWGPDAKLALPADRSQIVRIDGTFSVSDGALVCDGLNDKLSSSGMHHGHMYSIARPSRGGFAKIRFKYDNDTYYDPQVGITLNRYRETREQAIERAGDPNIQWWNYGDNMIAVIWGTREHNDGPGISIRWINTSDWDCSMVGQIITTTPLNIPANTPYWLMASFHEGVLCVWHRADSSTHWIFLSSHIIQDEYTYDRMTPWGRADQKGRFGLYMYNETPYTTILSVNSDAIYWPLDFNVDQHSQSLPENEVYIANEEKIYLMDIKGTGNIRSSYSPDREYHIVSGVGQPTPNPSFSAPDSAYPLWSRQFTGAENSDPHHYDNGLVVIISGPGAGNVYEVANGGWDYDSPKQWQPTGYPMWDNVSPDWMDHIGDGAHGAWSTADFFRIFVLEDPKGAYKIGSTANIVYKGVCTRGYGGTTPTSHRRGETSSTKYLSLFTESRAYVDRFHVFTSEREWSYEDMIFEIARKAGVKDISSKKHLNQSFTRTSSSWALSSQIESNGIKQSNCVVRALPSQNGAFGIQFGRKKVSGSWTGGWALMMENGSYVVLYNADSKAIIEKIPIAGINATGWITFSVQDNRAMVYENEQLIAAFKLPTDIDTQSWAAPAYRGISGINYDWPELAGRVDNFIIDIGRKGVSVIAQLIGQKRIYWQDDQDGIMRLYRDRVTVNSGDPWEMASTGGHVFNEADLVTRARVEGAEAWQSIDESMLQEHGSVFKLFNAEDAENAQDASVEADWLLNDLKLKANQYTLEGAADPRVEAGDIIEVTIPTGYGEGVGSETISVIVDGISMNMKVDTDNATFDMVIQGHNANE